MSKEKLFGDIKDGDIIWKEDRKNWQIIPIQVIKVEKTEKDPDCVRVYIPDGTNFMVTRDSCRYDLMYLWSDKEKAFQFALEKAKKERDYLSRKIDEMISIYDEIEKFIKEYDKH